MNLKRERWIDTAKGIGIILVVFGHVERGLWDSNILKNEYFKIIDSIIYTFHIPLFFFLSGYLFYNSIKKYSSKQLILNKLKVIAYPYIVWSLIQGTVQLFLSSFTNEPYSLKYLYSILWHPNDQFWFLYALFLIFIVAIFLYKNCSNYFLIFVISAAVYSFEKYLPQNTPFFIIYITNYFTFFAGGFVFHKIKKFSSFHVQPSTFLILAFIVSQFVYHFILKMNFEDKNIFHFIVAFISIISVIVFSMKIKSNLLEYLGKISLQIYLLHVLFGSGARIVLYNFFNIHNAYLHLIAGMIAGIISSAVFYELTKNFRYLYKL